MRGRILIFALVCLATVFADVSTASAGFGIVENSLSASAITSHGSPDLFAGSHPFAYTVNVAFNHDAEGDAEGSVRDVLVKLPLGMVGDPTAVPQCPREALESFTAVCPGNSQVGTFSIVSREPPSGSGLTPSGPIYNLTPPPGVAASFGFAAVGFNAVENVTLTRTQGVYSVTVATNNIPLPHIVTVSETIWGVPGDPRHDAERQCVGPTGEFIDGCPSEGAPRPFLRLPTSCAAPMATDLEADPVEAPGVFSSARALSLDSGGSPAGLIGCESLEFNPSISVRPGTSAAASASGLHVDLHLPQPSSVGGLGEADLRDATVVFPAGLVLNPAAANGLAACSSAQIDLESSSQPACPAASEVGTVEVDTPLLDHPLPGTVYVAAQDDNPFHSLLAVYLVVDDPVSGVVVKLAGHVETDAATGQLTTTFSANPQLPFEDLKLDLASGQRAPLVTPDTCGVKTTTTSLTPWSAPEGQIQSPSSTFVIASGPQGGSCASTPAEEPNQPAFEAGTTTSTAGSFSPFVLKLSRDDGSQAIGSLELVLPPGLSGKLAGIARCADAQIGSAQSPGRSGREEQASPSCPVASEVGIVDVAAGAGSMPVHVGGRIYLAGPYKGAPFSLAIITPAVAGPFDLGVVVVRSPLYINPQTAQVTVKSDPIPTILDGIPLHVRTIAIDVNRSRFTLNPTNCDPMGIAGVEVSAIGAPAPLSSPFQVGGCAGLPFKPSLTATTQGKTSKLAGASLRVKVTARPGEANVHKVELQLPVALPSRLTTLQKACLAGQFAANPAGCPEGSVIGTAVAVTPILNVPLTGPAFLVSHGGAKFPDVVFLLQGEGVKIELTGHTDIKKGITFSRFETVPDAPISSFETTLPEGPHSVLSAFDALCSQRLEMPTTIIGQNGAQLTQKTNIAVTGCPKPVFKLKHAKVTSSAAQLTFTISQPVTITIAGKGLKTTMRSVSHGTRQIRIPFTNVGRHVSSRHQTAKLHITLKGPSSTVRTSLRLKL